MSDDVATPWPELPTSPGAGTTGAAGVSSLADRARAALERLDPPSVSIPAPRSASGVVPAPRFGSDPDDPSPELRAAAQRLVDALAALEERRGPTDRTLARIVELVSHGVPEAGWSAAEGIEVGVLRRVAGVAGSLGAQASELLVRLDAEQRHGSAATIDSLATTLRVVDVVAGLEVFERDRR